MLATDLSDTLRARLARTFMEHEADLGIPTADDQAILDHVDDILELLLCSAEGALELRCAHWFRRFSWFVTLIEDMVEGRQGKSLDG
jgi:hypothetical protein